jgi:hypothetical protein
MTKKILISEEQKKFLREQKGILFEYYIQASNPKKDTEILGDLQVWVYGDDRNGFTPHCHVMTIDKSTEFEVSLIDWKVINVKQGTPTKKMQKRFMEWLDSINSRGQLVTNRQFLYMTWDGANQFNDLADFCEKHNIIPNDEDLRKYIESQKENAVLV